MITGAKVGALVRAQRIGGGGLPEPAVSSAA